MELCILQSSSKLKHNALPKIPVPARKRHQHLKWKRKVQTLLINIGPCSKMLQDICIHHWRSLLYLLRVIVYSGLHIASGAAIVTAWGSQSRLCSISYCIACLQEQASIFEIGHNRRRGDPLLFVCYLECFAFPTSTGHNFQLLVRVLSSSLAGDNQKGKCTALCKPLQKATQIWH